MSVVLPVLSLDPEEDVTTLVLYFHLLPKSGIVVTFVALLGLHKSRPSSMHCLLEPMFPLSFEVALWFLLCGHWFQGQGS